MSQVDNKKSDSSGRKRRKCKRPATSPLSNETAPSTSQFIEHGVTKSGPKSGCPKQHKQTTQVNPDITSDPNATYAQFLANSFYNMAYQQPPSYGMPQPFMSSQSSPFGMQAPPLTPPSAATPVWATELIEEMKQIKEKLKGIEKIEKTVNSINAKVIDLETKMSSLDKRVLDTEQSCQFSAGEIEQSKNELKNTKEELKKVQKRCENLENETKCLSNKNEILETKVEDIESRSMRENLLFHGIVEQGESEDCTKLVKNVLKEKLNMEPKAVDDMIFDRAHRLGGKSGKIRPVVVKFHYYHEREAVRKTSFNFTNELKQANMGIGPQIPKEIRDARRPLYSAMKNAKDAGKRTRFVGRKLFIDGREYRPSTPTSVE